MNVWAAAPNAISGLRLVLGAAFFAIPPPWRVAALGVAALSDFLDGYLSRRWGQTSETGRLLDPIADKVFVAGAALTFWHEQTLSPFDLLALGVRDVLVTLGAIVAALLRLPRAAARMRPRLLGKATTAAQFGAFLATALNPGPADAFMVWDARTGFIAAAAILGIAASFDYLVAFFRRSEVEETRGRRAIRWLATWFVGLVGLALLWPRVLIIGDGSYELTVVVRSKSPLASLAWTTSETRPTPFDWPSAREMRPLPVAEAEPTVRIPYTEVVAVPPIRKAYLEREWQPKFLILLAKTTEGRERWTATEIPRRRVARRVVVNIP